MGLVPLADGGFVYVTADPTIGRYDGQLKRVLHRRSDIADFRGQIKHLRLSMDGARVAFGLEKGAWLQLSLYAVAGLALASLGAYFSHWFRHMSA